MALKWIEGFEHDFDALHATRKYAFVNGGGTSAAGRLFGNAWNLSGVTNIRRTKSFGVQNTWIFGFGLFVPSNFTASTNGFYLLKNTTEQISLRFSNTAGSFNLSVNRGSTVLGTTTSNFAYNVWHYFELKVTVDPVSGAYELRWNESNVLSGTGVNTANEGTAGADIFEFAFTSTAASIRVDDFYLCDSSGAVNNNFLGEMAVEGVKPNADGALVEWTPGTGTTHFNLVDDINTANTDGTDVVHSDTNGQRDLYGFVDLTQTNGTIAGVMVNVQSAMNAAGSRTLRHKFRSSGGTIADGASFTVTSTTYQGFQQLWEVDPVTTLAWTNSGIDGGQFGIENVS